ncbi:hypothetical protein PInf_008960 [Phytophthora infestans]|nr:hypothetical protein PInf_008851 [Phytophthora infestans]KAI9981305.1 hypothetical protein PInf_008960 [Phytophthora infestans]
MEIAQIPTQCVDIVEPVNGVPLTEGNPTDPVGNNHAESQSTAADDKTLEPELAFAEENRPVAILDACTDISNGEEGVASEIPVSPRSGRLSEGAEVVTPAGTVEAPVGASDTPSAEREEKEAEAPAINVNDTETETYVVEREPHHETITPSSVQATPPPTSTESTPPLASAPSPTKKASEKKQANHDSFASEEVLNKVQKFLTLQNFTLEATAKGEEVSIDIQSNVCLIEQMFLTLGRRSPLEDMYTAEEEEMLDLLFHSNSSNNLPLEN